MLNVVLKMTSQGATPESSSWKVLFAGITYYKQTWTPFLGEKLLIGIEEDNGNDARAVAILKGGIVVGHLPRETARIVWYFLKRGGNGCCEVRNWEEKEGQRTRSTLWLHLLWPP